MSKKSVYITTTLPYVNADPHVGFAMEIIRADALARYHTLLGNDVFFNTGTDEHGQKLLRDAEKAGKDVQEYVDMYAEKFRGLKDILGIKDDINFIRTTDEHHVKAAQEMWKRVKENGYIYKKQYQTKYCVGCELEKTDSELVEGKCPIHPNKEIELIDEENYFFAFSKLEDKLKDLYSKKETLVIPEFRFNEMKAFLDRGLQDFSISRLKSKMSWGVPVPDDEDHVMYVWFDALTNYISALGWSEDEKGNYKKFWEEGLKIQYCGKDNIRQQSMMWQAILLAANLPTTDHIIINGFINSGGQKMSKSLGNVINPYNVVKDYETVTGDLSADVLRYYLLRHVNSFEDSDMTLETIKEAYNANLANGLGNLVSRIMTLAEKYIEPITKPEISEFPTEYTTAISAFEFDKALTYVFGRIQVLDKKITETEPFKVVKVDVEKGKTIILELVQELYLVAQLLNPFLPKTNQKIKEVILENKKPSAPLFLRKD
jgi:methionyl-tRNA synthetase